MMGCVISRCLSLVLGVFFKIFGSFLRVASDGPVEPESTLAGRAEPNTGTGAEDAGKPVDRGRLNNVGDRCGEGLEWS